MYYDADTGFGSIQDTYKQATRILKTITIADVKVFLERQRIRPFKPYKGFNSYVAHEPLDEIQVYIANFTRSAEENDGFRYRLVGIYFFCKLLFS